MRFSLHLGRRRCRWVFNSCYSTDAVYQKMVFYENKCLGKKLLLLRIFCSSQSSMPLHYNIIGYGLVVYSSITSTPSFSSFRKHKNGWLACLLLSSPTVLPPKLQQIWLKTVVKSPHMRAKAINKPRPLFPTPDPYCHYGFIFSPTLCR